MTASPSDDPSNVTDNRQQIQHVSEPRRASPPHNTGPCIVIDGTTTTIPASVESEWLESLQQQCSTAHQVIIHIGQFWSLPLALQTTVARICAAAPESCRYSTADGQLLASPIEALFRIAQTDNATRVTGFAESAILLATVYFPGDAETAEQELKQYFRAAGIPAIRSLRQKILECTRRLTRNTSERERIRDLINDPSIDSDLYLPPNWDFDPQQNCMIKNHGPARGEFTDRIDGLLFVNSKSIDRDSQQQTLELCWWSRGVLRRFMVPREQLLRCNQAEALASLGLPISSVTSKLFVSYFVNYLEENDFRLLSNVSVSRLGWVLGQSVPTFVLGDRVIRPENAPADELIRFDANDPATAQMGQGFRASGSAAESLRMLVAASQFPVIWFAMLTSLSSALLEPLTLQGFIVDLCGETSGGKTTTVTLVASLFGNPARNCDTSVWHGWDCTQVSIERLAAIYQSLLVILDDTRLAQDAKLVGAVTYVLANGTNRKRGNKTGIDACRAWRLNALSTGEQSLVSFQDNAGMRARIITLRGTPFVGRGENCRQMAEHLQELAFRNYGHIGPAFVQQIVNHYADVERWRARIVELKSQLAPHFAQNAVAGRHLDYLALITLTAELCVDWFNMPAPCRDPISGVRQLLLTEYVEADRPREAVEKLLDFINQNPGAVLDVNESVSHHSFPDHRPPRPQVIGRRVVIGGEHSPSLAVYHDQFCQLMVEFNVSDDEVVSALKQRGWLHLGENSRPLKNVNAGTSIHPGVTQSNRTVRCVCIKGSVIDWLQAGRDAEAVVPVPNQTSNGN